MLDIHSLLKNLKRPQLLVKAARFGVDDFRRETDLLRLLQTEKLPRPTEALVRLLDLESAVNEDRTTQAAYYNLSRHIELLTAIMSEQRMLNAYNEDP